MLPIIQMWRLGGHLEGPRDPKRSMLEAIMKKGAKLEDLGIRTIFLGNGVAGFRGFKLMEINSNGCFPGVVV